MPGPAIHPTSISDHTDQPRPLPPPRSVVAEAPRGSVTTIPVITIPVAAIGTVAVPVGTGIVAALAVHGRPVESRAAAALDA